MPGLPSLPNNLGTYAAVIAVAATLVALVLLFCFVRWRKRSKNQRAPTGHVRLPSTTGTVKHNSREQPR